MKKPLRLIAALLAVCVLTAALPPVGLASAGDDLRDYVNNAANGVADLGGQTITLNDTGGSGSADAPYVIDKPVTIQNGTIVVRAGGFVLGADVTFSNVELQFITTAGNYIAANGHTLTLDNARCVNRSGDNSCNLFGGTMTGTYAAFTVPEPGPESRIIIGAGTSLQGAAGNTGSIYAGNLFRSTDGTNPTRAFARPVQISITGKVTSGALGAIYASGAAKGSASPTADGGYTVSGGVEISGVSLPPVNGAGAETHVAYRGDNNLAALEFTDLCSLSVESGNVVLAAGSCLRSGGALSVSSGAKLDLRQTDSLTLNINDFNGGGFLFLGQSQLLRIAGQVTGTSKVAVEGTNFDNTQSAKPPSLGHTYISAPKSVDGNFELLPYGSSNLILVRDANGGWTASSGGGAPDLVRDFRFETASASAASGVEAEFSMDVTGAAGSMPYLDFIPLEITINGRQANREEETDEDGATYYRYADRQGYLPSLEVNTNTLYVVSDAEFGPGDSPYTIEVTVPAAYTEGGVSIKRSVTLTVTAGGGTQPDPGLTSVPVPAANAGLRYTGLEQTGVDGGTGYTLTGHKAINVGGYTAIAALEPGYQWADGSTDSKNIPWSIAKALTAAPTGLSAAAPTSANGSDGRITGTTPGMEYAVSPDFAGAADCAGGETAGLPPGTYYVRFKETATHEAGAAAVITVPAYGAPTVASISVNSSGHKTEYTVGDGLDVSGLTVEAVFSDQTARTVAVTPEMVGGFDSSAAGSLTLTITYEGAQTTYTVRVSAPSQPPAGHTHAWSAAWAGDKGHHWHECEAQDCPAAQDSEKDGYAAHTPGAWIVEQAATATQSGVRRRECTVCGYETARQTIPATGGGSSSGGGWYPSNPGNVTSSTHLSPDGTTTTTSTNHVTGAVTATVKRPDGSQTVTVTEKSGAVTTTETAADGSTVKTVELPDGSSAVSVRRADGVSAETSVDRYGGAQARVNLSASAVGAAQSAGGAVLLPIPTLPVTKSGSAAVTVHTGSAQPVKVEIPAAATAGTVPVIIHGDGSRTVVRTSSLTQRGIVAAVPDGAVVRLVDNGAVFSDTRNHWAREAVSFVSARELFLGRSAELFDPNGTMTRAMAVTVLARLDGADTGGGAQWYEPGLAWAAAHGVSDGRNPNGNVTREQLAAMLYRYAGSPAVPNRPLPFTDAEAVSGYAREAMCWAVEAGILNGLGDGSLDPRGEATRAQTAAMLQRYVDFLNRPAG